MIRLGTATFLGLLLLLGSAGCSLTREPRPPRQPEELRPPPDEARYQSPRLIYPDAVLNQDDLYKTREDAPKTMFGKRGGAPGR